MKTPLSAVGLYSIVAILVAVGSMVLLVLFLFPFTERFGIDQGREYGGLYSVFANIGLLAIFGIQHSMMAREKFKSRLPPEMERSTYVMASGLAILVILLFWSPLPEVIWMVRDESFILVTYSVAFCGGLLSAWAVICLDPLSLFGLRQAGVLPPAKDEFRVGTLHSIIRHPIYTGMLLLFWATPDMSLGHLVFSIGMTIYIRIGIHFEERALISRFGEEYLRYRERVPMLFPWLPVNRYI